MYLARPKVDRQTSRFIQDFNTILVLLRHLSSAKATVLKDQKKKAEEEGTEPPDVAELDPPFLPQYCNFVEAAVQQKRTEKLHLNKSWVVDREEIAQKKGITDVDCTIFRCKVLKTGAGGHKMQFGFMEKNFNMLMSQTLQQYGWVCQAGPAPRGGFESQIQSFVDCQRRQWGL